ncbi:MAG: LacI family DNA-binding transcriptional regulator [Chloroflexota bacterium]|jgi:LacI family transcriptional regulator
MAVGIKDLAREAGLSVATVSKALNEYADVSEETRQRVREIARLLNYQPNITARGLQSRRTNMVGLVIPTVEPHLSDDPYFLDLLAGIADEAAENEFALLLTRCAPGPKERLCYQKIVRGRRVDGLIVVRTRSQDQRVAYLLEEGFPFVTFGRTEQGLDFPFVDVDGTQGLYDATRYLIGLGHRRIGFIAAPEGLMFGFHRQEGFRKAMEEAGLAMESGLLVRGDLTLQSGYVAMGQLLDRDPPPTAVVACNDLMALGAMRGAQERGLWVGRDLAVVGFDDTHVAAHSRPSLTTVSQPIYDIGILLCRMLLQTLQGKPLEVRQILLRPALVIRESSGGTIS